MNQWALTMVIGGLGLFFLVMTYGALISSKKSGHYSSGVPLIGGTLIAIAFLISPMKWLAFLGLLDYGFWMILSSLVKNFIAGRKLRK